MEWYSDFDKETIERAQNMINDLFVGNTIFTDFFHTFFNWYQENKETKQRVYQALIRVMLEMLEPGLFKSTSEQDIQILWDFFKDKNIWDFLYQYANKHCDASVNPDNLALFWAQLNREISEKYFNMRLVGISDEESFSKKFEFLWKYGKYTVFAPIHPESEDFFIVYKDENPHERFIVKNFLRDGCVCSPNVIQQKEWEIIFYDEQDGVTCIISVDTGEIQSMEGELFSVHDYDSFTIAEIHSQRDNGDKIILFVDIVSGLSFKKVYSSDVEDSHTISLVFDWWKLYAVHSDYVPPDSIALSDPQFIKGSKCLGQKIYDFTAWRDIFEYIWDIENIIELNWSCYVFCNREIFVENAEEMLYKKKSEIYDLSDGENILEAIPLDIREYDIYTSSENCTIVFRYKTPKGQDMSGIYSMKDGAYIDEISIKEIYSVDQEFHIHILNITGQEDIYTSKEGIYHVWNSPDWWDYIYSLRNKESLH